MTDEPKLTEAQREALADALHDDIDGDFLVGADGYGEDIAMQHAGAADVVRWAVNATGPVVARVVATAEQTTPLPPEPATTPTCGKCGSDLPERGCCPCIGQAPAPGPARPADRRRAMSDCRSPWWAGLTCDHLYADCPNRSRAEKELRNCGWWDGNGRGEVDPHGGDVCGMCLYRHQRTTHKGKP